MDSSWIAAAPFRDFRVLQLPHQRNPVELNGQYIAIQTWNVALTIDLLTSSFSSIKHIF